MLAEGVALYAVVRKGPMSGLLRSVLEVHVYVMGEDLCELVRQLL